MRLLAAGKPNGQALAARVRERFGRPAFQAKVAEAMTFLGLGGEPASGAPAR